MTAARPRVVVFAYHDMGALGLRACLAQGAQVVAVVTHADDPAEAVWFESVAALGIRAGIPVLTPRHPREPGLVEAVRALRPDLLFSFYYRRLLPPALLGLPRLGAINLHGSLLPKYRGRAPLNWVLVNGEAETGVTLHHMDEQADHGDIIAQRAVPIGPEETAPMLWRKLLAAAEALLLETYPLIAAGAAPRRPQDHAAATTFGRRRPADGLVDWCAPAGRVHNLIRAVTHPFPGAFTFLEGRQVFLWAGRPVPGPSAAEPGAVLGAQGRTLRVAAGDGAVEVLRIQAADRPEMDGEEFFARVLEGRRAVFGRATSHPRWARRGSRGMRD
jgi:methionyl-tRNA formyltransferase